MSDHSQLPRATVVIPTRDRLAFLQEAVQSAALQEGVDVTVLVVDDQSSDGTAEWLAAAPWPNVRVIRQAEHRDKSAARNTGLAACESPFVLFLDDDDRLRPGSLALLGRVLSRAPSAAGAAGAAEAFGATAARRLLHPRWRMTVPVWREELFDWNIQPGTLLWRTDVVRALGGWDESLPRANDRDINLRAYPRKFALVPNVVVDWRIHEGQVPIGSYEDQARHVVRRFVDTLTGRDREVAERIVAAREPFYEGLSRYVAGEYTQARRAFGKTIRHSGLATSPILGPWFAGLWLKSAIGGLRVRAPRAG